MSKLIALKSGSHEILPDGWNNDFSYLKQQVLLFDQIRIFKLKNLYKALTESLDLLKKLSPSLTAKPETMVMELQWLQEAGVIFELDIQEEFAKETLSKTRLSPNFETAKELLAKVINIQTFNPLRDSNNPETIELLKEQQFSLIRLMAIIIEANHGVSAVTTVPYTEHTLKAINSKKSDVIQIVIKELPLPNNETPWEKIIEYKNDPDTQKKLSLLRRWISKTARQELSSLEIKEEIEFLINDFQEHMKIHEMKANTETLEVMINSSADIIHNLLTLKFSQLVSPPIAIKKRQLALLEAELNAPGRELTYLIKTKEVFHSSE